jgi:hypothetical protein
MADPDPTHRPGPRDLPSDLPRSTVLQPQGDDRGGCEACGSPQARSWSTTDGPARLCPPCATLNGIGCP